MLNIKEVQKIVKIFKNDFVLCENNTVIIINSDKINIAIKCDFNFGERNCYSAKSFAKHDFIFGINGLDVVDGYNITINSKKPRVKIQTKFLIDALPFTSKEEARYYLQGVNIDDENISATNGHFLYTQKHFTVNPYNVIVKKEFIELAKLLKVSEIEINSQYAILETENIVAFVGHIDACYPDYKRVIPNDYKTDIEGNEIVDTIKNIFIIDDIKKSLAAVKKLAKKDRIFKLQENKTFIKEAYIDAISECNIGLNSINAELGINTKYAQIIFEALANQNVKNITAKQWDNSAPVKFNNDDFTIVLMPVRV